MTRAETRTVVAVKVFVEQNVIAPVGVGLKLLGAPIHRPATILVAHKGCGKPIGDLVAHLKEVQHVAGSGWTLNLKTVAVVGVELQQRSNDHDVYRKPHRTSP